MPKLYNTASVKVTYLLCLFISIIASPVFAQMEFLDPTFGSNGKVSSLIPNSGGFILDMAIQADGKIIVAGGYVIKVSSNYSTVSLLIRYNTNGSIDSSFGFQGSATITFGLNNFDIRSIAIQQDGKIVAGGTNQELYHSDTHFALVRFNSNGSVDSSFGKNGVVTTAFQNIGDQQEELTKVIIKPDGKILAGGYSFNSFGIGLPVSVVMSQYNKDGSYDNSFGKSGIVISSTSKGSTVGFTMALRFDNKIVAGGPHGNSSFASMQFNTNGSIDSTFGLNGFGDTATSFSATDELLQRDGKIIFVGRMIVSRREVIALLRYNSNGTFDTTFGNYGKVTTSMSNFNNSATSAHLDSSGKILVSGSVYQTSSPRSADFALLRYNPNGTLDSTFGKGGIILTDFSGNEDVSFSSAIQTDGKIVLAGISRDSAKSSTYAALARYSMIVMPLKLLSFTAIKEGKNNVLQWQTAQEINLDRFEIERSSNGRDYSSIGKVNSGLSNYTFTDNTALSGVNYYRIKMIDKDGKFEYSLVRTLINSGSFYVSIYPLPAKGRLNMQIESSKTGKATILVTDISGKTLITNSVTLAAGVNNTFIGVQSLSKGAYFLKIITSETTETRKIIVE
jgi:uncharacterized delta-60 repeat protein